jgi:hypothetical protein
MTGGFDELGVLSLHLHDIAQYRTCPQLFDFDRRGYLPRAQILRPKVIYGSLWHGLYVARYTEEPEADVFERVASQYHPALRPLLEQLWVEIPGDMDWYDEQVPELEFGETAWIERPGEHCVYEASATLRILYTPDRVTKITENYGGELSVVDHKTFTVVHDTAAGPRYERNPRELTRKSYFHSRQFPTYIGFWNRSNPEQRISQAVLNLVPQRVSYVLDFLTTRKGKPEPPKVDRDVIPYDESYCERLVNETVAIAEEIENKLRFMNIAAPQVRATMWPQHPDACFDFNDTCPMLEACESGDEQRAVILESLKSEV